MAHKPLIGGTAYEVTGGRPLVGGTGYGIKKGRTLVGGTGYDILFGSVLTIDATLKHWSNITENMQVILDDETMYTSSDVYASGAQEVDVAPGMLVTCRFNSTTSAYLYFKLNGTSISRDSSKIDTMVFRINGETTITMAHGATTTSTANSTFTFEVVGDAEYVSQGNDVT